MSNVRSNWELDEFALQLAGLELVKFFLSLSLPDEETLLVLMMILLARKSQRQLSEREEKVVFELEKRKKQ